MFILIRRTSGLIPQQVFQLPKDHFEKKNKTENDPLVIEILDKVLIHSFGSAITHPSFTHMRFKLEIYIQVAFMCF